MNQTKKNLLISLSAAAIMAVGMFVGTLINQGNESASSSSFLFSFPSSSKIDKVFQIIDDRYVDSVNIDEMENKTMRAIMAQLDPHSQFVNAVDYKSINESLEGNFEGIGIEFHMLKDSLLVVAVIPDSPCDEKGIQAGDRIVSIDTKRIIGVKNADVIKLLHGPRGTDVTIGVVRSGKKPVNYVITRGQVPIKSIEVGYMLNVETGYIKIAHFGATTHEEFLKIMFDLKSKGLKNLVLDLRGNGGGYLRAATALADEFLPNKQLIVYTQGRKQPREDYFATSGGEFEKGKLIVLIDENTASASEILAGAIQDTERGIVIGRRSYGKGLVQDQVKFPDGSGLRLTIARYYTPLGRSIQKPYSKGVEEYKNDGVNRFKHGDLFNADSNKLAFNGLVQYRTPSGKVVYGGGGIMPDYFVPLDTTKQSKLFDDLLYNNVISDYGYVYVEKNINSFKKYPSLDSLVTNFTLVNRDIKDVLILAEAKNVKCNISEIKKVSEPINKKIKAMVARWTFGEEGFYRVVNADDKMIAEALNVLSIGQFANASIRTGIKKK